MLLKGGDRQGAASREVDIDCGVGGGMFLSLISQIAVSSRVGSYFLTETM